MANPHTTTDDWPALLQERFQPIEVLARGRISTVWKARDDQHQRPVALKILHPHLADKASIRQRMRRELATVRRLHHPAIIDIFDVLEGPNQAVLVMEWVDGLSLREHLQTSGPMSWEEARSFLKPLLEAIGQAHERGIWHRDLSSDHIMIDRQGDGRIVGFGMARVNELVGLTQHTRLLGSLEAMAPERLLGLDYDGRADLYSLGAVAHELLIGHGPTDGSMQQSFSRATRLSAADGPQLDLPEDLPEQAHYFLERALMGDPSLRFATADQMARALDDEGHRDLWEAWSARTHQPCPDCQAPLIDGLQRCIQCGHELQRLFDHPGDGEFILSIIPPSELEKDDWSVEEQPSKQLPSPHLTQRQHDQLLGLINDHVDTRRACPDSHLLLWPPYVLADQLTMEDLKRMHLALKERSIPHRVYPDHVRAALIGEERSVVITTHDYPYGQRPDLPLSDDIDRTVFFLFILMPILITASITSFFITEAFVVVIVIMAAGLNALIARNFHITSTHAVGVILLFFFFPMVFIFPDYLLGTLVSLLCFPLAFVTSRYSLNFIAQRIAARRSLSNDPDEHHGRALLSAQHLQQDRPTSGGLHLPEETAKTLQRCQHAPLRAQLHDLLALATRLADEARLEDQDAFTELLRTVLDTTQALDDLLTHIDGESTADLHARLEQADDEATRQQLLQAIDERDDTLQRITALRSILQTTRGALLDLAYQAHQTPIRTTSSFQDRVTNALEDIEINLSAALEAHDLAPEAS